MELSATVLASAALALGWTKASACGMDDGGAPPSGAGPPWLWRLLVRLGDLKQVLPAMLIFLAAESCGALLWVSVTFGITLTPSASWLGGEELGLGRRWALLLALMIWLAEQLENMLQRMQRCMRSLRSGGGRTLRLTLNDPMGWIWTPSWAIARRVALLIAPTLGVAPFLHTLFPAVVMDNFLGWVQTSVENLLSRKGLGLPMSVSTLVVPLLDTLHFLPVLTRVVVLALVEYPRLDAPVSRQAMLSVSSLVWTGHNVHTLYDTGGQLWDSFRQSLR